MLWFIKTRKGVLYYEADELEPIRERLRKLMSRGPALTDAGSREIVSLLKQADLDLIDLIELVVDGDDPVDA